MPRFLNPANFIFRSSTRLVRYYFNFQNFYALPYIHFLSLVELERWLAEMRSFPHQHRRQHSSAQDTSGQGYSPDPSSCSRPEGSGVQTRRRGREEGRERGWRQEEERVETGGRVGEAQEEERV